MVVYSATTSWSLEEPTYGLCSRCHSAARRFNLQSQTHETPHQNSCVFADLSRAVSVLASVSFRTAVLQTSLSTTSKKNCSSASLRKPQSHVLLLACRPSLQSFLVHCSDRTSLPAVSKGRLGVRSYAHAIVACRHRYVRLLGYR